MYFENFYSFKLRLFYNIVLNLIYHSCQENFNQNQHSAVQVATHTEMENFLYWIHLLFVRTLPLLCLAVVDNVSGFQCYVIFLITSMNAITELGIC